MRVLCICVGVVCLLVLLQRSLCVQIIPATTPSHEQQGVNSTNASCDCVCGQYSRMTRIVGGQEAYVHEFPWIVLLSYRNKFYCGGTLITASHILTAAHCTQQVQKKHITVTIGEHNRNQSAAEVQTRRVVKMSPHRQFSLATFNHDIAVLELDKPVTLSGTAIRPACLPNKDGEDYAGRSATVAGWGRLSERRATSDSLQKVSVPIMSTEECKSKGYPDNKITDNMICAGYRDGKKDACQGDSGGPLHALDANNVTEVIGIVSWGRGCARPNYPGVYTRVARYLGWIDKHLDGECRCSRRPGTKTRTPRDSGEVQQDDSPVSNFRKF